MQKPHRLEQLTVDGYDLIATHFDGTRRNFWSELSYISEYIQDGQTVLDLGSGNSRLYEILKHKEIQYIGVDGSKKLIEIAQKRYPHLELHTSFSHSIPIADSSIDTVVSLALIHHLTENTLSQTLSEVYRVLKPNGVLILTSWNTMRSRKRDIWKQYFLGLMRKGPRLSFGEILIPFSNLGNLRFVKRYSKRQLYKLLTKKGFALQDIYTKERSVRSENIVLIAKKKD